MAIRQAVLVGMIVFSFWGSAHGQAPGEIKKPLEEQIVSSRMRTAGIATTIAGGIVAITGSVMLGVGLSNSHMDMLDLTGIFITPLGASAVLTGVPLWMIGDTSKRRRSSAGAWGGTVMTTLGVAMVMAGAVFLPMGVNNSYDAHSVEMSDCGTPECQKKMDACPGIATCGCEVCDTQTRQVPGKTDDLVYVGTAMLVTGALVTAGGIVLWAYSSKPGPRQATPAVSLLPELSVGLAHASLTWTF